MLTKGPVLLQTIYVCMFFLDSGGLEEPDIVAKVVADEADFIDFENSECHGNYSVLMAD